MSVFTKSFWQAPMVWVYIKQEEGAGRMNQCFCVCGSPATQAGGPDGFWPAGQPAVDRLNWVGGRR